MDTEDLLPRLALVGTLVAAVVVYTRRRGNKLKKVEAQVASLPSQAAEGAADAAATITARSQSMLEGMLDSIAEQAMKELKVVLKDGLKRIEKIVDEL